MHKPNLKFLGHRKSRGVPRNGQWVILDGKYVGVCSGPAIGGENGHKVSHDPMSGERLVTRIPRTSALTEIVGGEVRSLPAAAENEPYTEDGKAVPDLWCFHLVHKDKPMEAGPYLVHIDRLAPVTDAKDIPAWRRKSHSPRFTPVP